MQCSKCGAENPEGNILCSSCGVRLSELQKGKVTEKRTWTQVYKKYWAWILIASIVVALIDSAIVRDFDPFNIGQRGGISLLILVVLFYAFWSIKNRLS